MERPGGGAQDRRRDDQSHFFLVVLLIAIVGLAGRLTYLSYDTHAVIGDGVWYHLGANLLADGHGFLNPYSYFISGVKQPGANHPPAWTVVLGAGSFVGLRSETAHGVIACVVGSATIMAAAVAGRRLRNARTGLVAAVFAAAYPNFWLYEAQLLSETLVILGAAVTILLALRYLGEPTLSRAAWLGAACGVMTLIRAEQVLLFAFLLVPVVVLAHRGAVRRCLQGLAIGVTTGLCVILPWVAFNIARFQEPTYLTANFGRTIIEANCDATYHGRYIGYWDPRCEVPANAKVGVQGGFGLGTQLAERHIDESVLDAEARRLGIQYARDHLGSLPAVVAAREGRTWGIFRPFQQMRLDHGSSASSVLRTGLFSYWLLSALAIIGVAMLRRSVPKLVVLGSFVATTFVAAAITIGQTRYRAPADVSIVLLAAVTVDSLWSRVSVSRQRVS